MMKLIGGALLANGAKVLVEQHYGKRRRDGAWVTRDGLAFRFDDPRLINGMVDRLVASGKPTVRDGLVRARYTSINEAIAMDEKTMSLEHGAEFRRCLTELDVVGMIKLWRHCAPHLANLTRAEAEYALHLARTKMETLPAKHKLYSQRWLNERSAGSFMREDRRGH